MSNFLSKFNSRINNDIFQFNYWSVSSPTKYYFRSVRTPTDRKKQTLSLRSPSGDKALLAFASLLELYLLRSTFFKKSGAKNFGFRKIAKNAHFYRK
jgi:hypothetical protein